MKFQSKLFWIVNSIWYWENKENLSLQLIMILLETLFLFCITYYDIWYIRWNTISNTNPKYHNIIWQLVQDIEWEERVLTEGSNVDPRKTATEDHQSKSYSLLCYIFFYSDMEKQTPMQRPSEVETVFKEYTRDIMDAKYKTFVVMNWILCPLRSRHPNPTYNNCGGVAQIWWLQTLEFSSFI